MSMRLFEENWRAVAELNDEIRYSNGKDFQTLLMKRNRSSDRLVSQTAR